jgi:DDE_Tnp_1-associated/Transposase DDE domain
MDATPSLLDLLKTVPDPRRAEGKRHPLPAVLALLVLAMMAGMRGLQGVVDFGRNLPADVVAALGFTRPRTLAKSTLSEVLRAIDIQAFESVVSRWLQSRADRHGWTAIAIDGKSLRGATGEELPAVHLVAGYAHEARVVLAQLRVDRKTNEHKAALELLGLLPLAGAVVTADAMFTHADFCREILRAEGDYLLAVKENQPTLLRDIEAVFAADAAVSPLPTAPA